MVKPTDLPFSREPRTCTSYDIGTYDAPNDGIYGIYKSGKYSDLQITCQDKTFAVHKIILASESKVFAAMIDGNFKEAKTAQIDLPEDDPIVIDYLVRYLYQGEYDPSLLTADKEENVPMLPCKMHAEVYGVADKYHIPTLLRYAARLYDTAARMPGYEADHIKHYIDFLTSIPIVYMVSASNGGKDLRGLASSLMSNMAPGMERASALSEELRLLREEVIKNTPEFASDVALLLMRKSSPICKPCATGGESEASPPPKTRKYISGRTWCTVCGRGSLYCDIVDAEQVAEIAKKRTE